MLSVQRFHDYFDRLTKTCTGNNRGNSHLQSCVCFHDVVEFVQMSRNFLMYSSMNWMFLKIWHSRYATRDMDIPFVRAPV